MLGCGGFLRELKLKIYEIFRLQKLMFLCYGPFLGRNISEGFLRLIKAYCRCVKEVPFVWRVYENIIPLSVKSGILKVKSLGLRSGAYVYKTLLITPLPSGTLV